MDQFHQCISWSIDEIQRHKEERELGSQGNFIIVYEFRAAWAHMDFIRVVGREPYHIYEVWVTLQQINYPLHIL
jgi:hypothetical protein